MSRPFYFRHKPLSRWTVARAVRRLKARVEDAKAALADIGATWNDIDQTIVDEAEDRISDLENWLDATLRSIRERVEAGEHVGP